MIVQHADRDLDELRKYVEVGYVSGYTKLMVEDAIKAVDEYFGKDYAKKHPAIVLQYAQITASNMNAKAVYDAYDNILIYMDEKNKFNGY